MTSIVAAPKTPPIERRLAEIRRVVAEHFGVQRYEMTSRSRTEPLATVRQVAMFFCRELTEAPLFSVATSFGRGDHGTVAHACEAIPLKAERDPQLALHLANLRPKLELALEVLR